MNIISLSGELEIVTIPSSLAGGITILPQVETPDALTISADSTTNITMQMAA
jgi:hypothetical protein